MPLETKSMQGFDFTSDNRVVAMSQGRDGTPFPSPMFRPEPAVVALSKDYPPAHSKAANKDGYQFEQSMLYTMYGTVYPMWQTPEPAESWDQDPVMVQSMQHQVLDAERFRLNKTSPKAMHAAGILRYPQQVVGVSVNLDVDLCDLFPKDNPKYTKYYQSEDQTSEKIGWNQELLAEFEALVEDVREKVPWFDHVTCFYTTEHGLRLIYVLTKPIPVAGCQHCLEDKIRGMMMELAIAGFATDTGCCDWTRLMRAYRCWKGNRQIGHGGYYYFSWGDIRTGVDECSDRPDSIQAIDPESLPSYSTDFRVTEYLEHPNATIIKKVILGQKRINASGEVLEEPDMELGAMPTPEERQKLLYKDGGNGKSNILDRFHKKLKNLSLKNPKTSKQGIYVKLANQFSALLIEHMDNLEEFGKTRGKAGLHYGNFYATWDLCFLLRNELELTSGNYTPQFIYAVLVEPYLRAMDARAQAGAQGVRPEQVVCAEAWRAVVANYPIQFALRQQAEEEERRLEEQVENSKIEDELDTERNMEVFKQALSDMTGVPRDVLDPIAPNYLVVSGIVGRSVVQYRNGQLTYSDPVTNEPELLVKCRESGLGLIKYMKIKNEEQTHRTTSEILLDHGEVYGKNIRASRLVPHNKLNFVPEGGVLVPKFTMKLPGLSEEIEPVYHKCIDDYIRLLGGPEQEKLLDWFAKFVEIESPLPALYIHGAPSIGKGMITDGLKKLTARDMAANFGDALTNFQDFFYDTFFLLIDEDTAGANEFEKNVVGVLRRMIGGQLKQINVKGVKGMYIDGEWRLVITANNDDVFQIKSDLSQQDIEALNGRIFYLNTNPRTKELLQYLDDHGNRKGNDKGPGTETDRWDLKIAQHTLWLHENRQVQPGKRFLIEAPPSPWHEHLRVTSSGGLTICRVIADALRDMDQGQSHNWLILRKRSKNLYVLPDLLEVHVERNYPKFRGQVTRTLERLSHCLTRVSVKGAKRGKPVEHKPRAYRLDIPAVLNALHGRGYDVDFRHTFGDEMWKEVVPEDIRSDLDGPVEDHEDELLSKPVVPPPPPSPASDGGNIIPFPKEGAG